MKKLNNKGFTLIELLAVIVILAVVMGVAVTSVLGGVNNSKKSQLQNSAVSAADAFRTTYAEYSMTPTHFLGVALTGDITNEPDKSLNSLLNGETVSLESFKGGLNITVGSGTQNYLAFSAVKFDKTNSSFKVCMVANPKGSYYVANAAKKYVVASGSTDAQNAPTLYYGTLTSGTNYMWACSDNTKSW